MHYNQLQKNKLVQETVNNKEKVTTKRNALSPHGYFSINLRFGKCLVS